MKDFKTWWAKEEIFAGEGSRDAAEQAWDARQEEIDRLQGMVDLLADRLEDNHRHGLDQDDADEDSTYSFSQRHDDNEAAIEAVERAKLKMTDFKRRFVGGDDKNAREIAEQTWNARQEEIDRLRKAATTLVYCLAETDEVAGTLMDMADDGDGYWAELSKENYVALAKGKEALE